MNETPSIPADCDGMAKINSLVQLNGRELLVIHNALILYSQNELPDICDECEKALFKLMPKIEVVIEILERELDVKRRNQSRTPEN